MPRRLKVPQCRLAVVFVSIRLVEWHCLDFVADNFCLTVMDDLPSSDDNDIPVVSGLAMPVETKADADLMPDAEIEIECDEVINDDLPDEELICGFREPDLTKPC